MADEEAPATIAEPEVDATETVETDTPAPIYASDDHVIPADDEDYPEVLRGKPLSEVKRLAKQWQTEAASANAANRQLHEQQLEVARELLAARRGGGQPQGRQQQPTAHDPIVYVPSEDGTQAVPTRLSQLMAPFIQPLQERLEQVDVKTFINDSETARREAKPPNVTTEVWDKLRPEFGMYMSVNSLDTRDPNSWRAAFKESKARLALLGIPVAQQPAAAPNAPVGNATSFPATSGKNGMPKLSAADQRELDEVAAITGMKKGSPTYIKAAKSIAAEYSERNR